MYGMLQNEAVRDPTSARCAFHIASALPCGRLMRGWCEKRSRGAPSDPNMKTQNTVVRKEQDVVNDEERQTTKPRNPDEGEHTV